MIPGEGAGVGEAVALELIVEVRMRIDVEYGECRVALADCPQDRVGHRMIPAQR
jgi:hypothetical protein